jgi:DNA-binding IclR family transcriptional regulator
MSRGRPKSAREQKVDPIGVGAAADRDFVVALARGLELLASFRRDESILGNQELAQRCGLPKSTVSRLTHTLTVLGYLHYVPEAGKYRLGTATLALGASMLARLDVRRVARPLMAEVSVALGVRDGLSMVYIEMARGNTPVSIALEVGSRIPISTTAMGRAFLAVCSEEMRRGVLEEMWQSEGAKPGAIEAMATAAGDYSRLGCACSFGEWQPGVNAIGAAFDPGGGLPPMAINCGAPEAVASPTFLLSEVRPRLIELVRRLEGTMGL